MHEQPSPQFVALLERLGAAGPAELQAAHRLAVRLAHRLPLFDTIWIDALVQTGVLSLYQARLLHAGQGAELLAGPFLIVDRTHTLGRIALYRARNRENRQEVRLLLASANQHDETLPDRLASLREYSKRIHSPLVAPVRYAEVISQQAVVACDWIDDPTIEAHLIRQGRFAPQQVVEMATQLLKGLKAIEIAGLVHGDLTPRDVLISRAGRLTILAPGARAALRPAEGYAFADLDSCAYTAIPPERIRRGTPADPAGDMYAFGILCWHMLAGRAPFPLANSLATLRAIERGRLPDIAQIAVNVPAALATTIRACTSLDPAARPKSIHEVEQLLGQPSLRAVRMSARIPVSASASRSSLHARPPFRRPRWQVATAMAFLLLIVAGWIGFRQSTTAARSAKRAVAKTPPQVAPLGANTQSVQATAPAAAQDPNPAASPDRVVRTTYLEPPASVEDLRLPTDRPLYLASISPRSGQTIRGTDQRRPQIWITQGALVLVAEGVHFEGIDFVWRDAGTEVTPAFFRLQSTQVSFTNCTFQVAPNSTSRPVILHTSASADGRRRDLDLVTTTIRFDHCVARYVRSLVEQTRAEALVVQAEQVLLLDSDSAIEFLGAPVAGAPATLLFRSCTLRQVVAVVRIEDHTEAQSIGRVAIHAENCVFAPQENGALVGLIARAVPSWCADIEWGGQASIVALDSAMVGWQMRREDPPTQLDENLLHVTGLVRSEIEFSARSWASTLDSIVLGWSAPLLSDEPPGAQVQTLPTLERK